MNNFREPPIEKKRIVQILSACMQRTITPNVSRTELKIEINLDNIDLQ